MSRDADIENSSPVDRLAGLRRLLRRLTTCEVSIQQGGRAMTGRDFTGKSAAKSVLVCVFLFASFFAYRAFAEENAASVLAALGLRESIVAARDMKDWETPRKIVVLAD